MKKIQNLVFSQVRATALIVLNYRYGPTRRLGVNVTVIGHIRQLHGKNSFISKEITKEQGRLYHNQRWKTPFDSENKTITRIKQE